MEASIINKELNKMLVDIAAYDYSKILKPADIGIYDGAASLSLFYLNLYYHTKDESYYEKAFSYFEKAYNNINLNNLNFSHGATGVMWLLAYFKKKKIVDASFEEYLSIYDNLVYNRLDEYANDIDPMHGLCGMINYLLERDNDISHKCLVKILDILDHEKILIDNAISWETRAKPDVPETVTHINFGYAHGILAILFYLSKYVEKGIETKRSKELFGKGYQYFLSKINSVETTFFPSMIQQDEIRKTPRVSFCYGDLGLACGLLSIGENLKDKKIIALAKKTALNIAKLAIDNIQDIKDIGLCHGAAGNGYMFLRLYKKFKTDVLLQASKIHYEKLLKLKKEETIGIVGFTSSEFSKEKNGFVDKTDPGFICGTAGVGLSVITFLKMGKLQEWSKILLLS